MKVTQNEKNLESYIYTIIRQGFPELRELEIGAEFTALDYYSDIAYKNKLIVQLDNNLKPEKSDVIRGFIVTELYEHYLYHSLFGYRAFEFLADFIKPFENLYSRGKDKSIMNRGFSKELLAYTQYLEKTDGLRFYAGLTSQEIKRSMKISNNKGNRFRVHKM